MEQLNGAAYWTSVQDKPSIPNSDYQLSADQSKTRDDAYNDNYINNNNTDNIDSKNRNLTNNHLRSDSRRKAKTKDMLGQVEMELNEDDQSLISNDSQQAYPKLKPFKSKLSKASKNDKESELIYRDSSGNVSHSITPNDNYLDINNNFGENVTVQHNILKQIQQQSKQVKNIDTSLKDDQQSEHSSSQNKKMIILVVKSSSSSTGDTTVRNSVFHALTSQGQTNQSYEKTQKMILKAADVQKETKRNSVDQGSVNQDNKQDDDDEDDEDYDCDEDEDYEESEEDEDESDEDEEEADVENTEEEVSSTERAEQEAMTYFPFDENTGHLMMNKLPLDIVRKLIKPYGIMISATASPIQDRALVAAIAYYNTLTNEDTRTLIHEKMRLLESKLEHKLEPYTHIPFTSLNGIKTNKITSLIVIDNNNTITELVKHPLQNRINIKLSVVTSSKILKDITRDINNGLPIISAVSNSMLKHPHYMLHHTIKFTAHNNISNDLNGNQIIAITRIMLNQHRDLDSITNSFSQKHAIECLITLYDILANKDYNETAEVIDRMITWVKSLKSIPGTINTAILTLDDIVKIKECFEEERPLAVFCSFMNQPSVNIFAISNIAHTNTQGTLFEVEVLDVLRATNLYLQIPPSETGMILLQVELPIRVEHKDIIHTQMNCQKKLVKLISASAALNPGQRASNIIKQEEAKRNTASTCATDTFTHLAIAGCNEELLALNHQLLSVELTSAHGPLSQLKIKNPETYVRKIKWDFVYGADVVLSRNPYSERYNMDKRTIMIKLHQPITSNLKMKFTKSKHELLITLLTEHDAATFKNGGSEVASFRMIGPELVSPYARLIEQHVQQQIPNVQFTYVGLLITSYAVDDKGKTRTFRDIAISVFHPLTIDNEQLHEISNVLKNQRVDTWDTKRPALAGIFPIQVSPTTRGFAGIGFPKQQIQLFNNMKHAQIIGLNMDTHPSDILEVIQTQIKVKPEEIRLVIKVTIGNIEMFLVVFDSSINLSADTSLAQKLSTLSKWFRAVGHAGFATVYLQTGLPGILSIHPFWNISNVCAQKPIREIASSYSTQLKSVSKTGRANKIKKRVNKPKTTIVDWMTNFNPPPT